MGDWAKVATIWKNWIKNKEKLKFLQKWQINNNRIHSSSTIKHTIPATTTTIALILTIPIT